MASLTTRFMLFACSLVAVAFLAGGCDPVTEKDIEKVTIGGTEYKLKLAVDQKSREKGLGGVDELPADSGMLFVFPDAAVLKFYMKDCTIDLDIAFVDSLGIVTAVHTMRKEKLKGAGETQAAYEARLQQYPSGVPARFAIEIQPGALEKLGIKRGSKIDLDLPNLKALAK